MGVVATCFAVNNLVVLHRLGPKPKVLDDGLKSVL